MFKNRCSVGGNPSNFNVYYSKNSKAGDINPQPNKITLLPFQMICFVRYFLINLSLNLTGLHLLFDSINFFVSPLLATEWRWSPHIFGGLSPPPQSCSSLFSDPRKQARTSCSLRWTPSSGIAWSSFAQLRFSSASQTTPPRSELRPQWVLGWGMNEEFVLQR